MSCAEVDFCPQYILQSFITKSRGEGGKASIRGTHNVCERTMLQCLFLCPGSPVTECPVSLEMWMALCLGTAYLVVLVVVSSMYFKEPQSCASHFGLAVRC